MKGYGNKVLAVLVVTKEGRGERKVRGEALVLGDGGHLGVMNKIGILEKFCNT